MKKTIFVFSVWLMGNYLFAQSDSYPLSNPLAGNTTYDYNLNVGDSCVVIDGGLSLKTMKIHEKKSGMYRVAAFNISDWEIRNQPSSVKWYKANSVYPYFSIQDFTSKTKAYKNTIASLLNCLSEKKGIALNSLTGTTSQWPTYYIKDDAEYKSMQADLDNCRKVLLSFKNLPNTFMGYENNPGIWIAVLNDAQNLLDCLKAVPNPEITRIVTRILSEIETAKTTATNFTGGTEGLWNCSGCMDYMFSAVSAEHRKDYFNRMTGFNSDAESVKKIDQALDDLKVICASKISLLKSPDWYYKYTLDSGTETIMKNYLKSASSLTIYKKGISDPDWQIEKNVYGIPLYRYKRAQMWIRNPNSDHSYCKILFYVIKSDYNGNSYGSSYVNEYREQLCGCP